MKKTICITIIALFFCLCGCVAQKQQSGPDMNSIAESYVRLALKVGLYDPDFIDAYFGPKEWRPAELSEEQKKEFPYGQLRVESKKMLAQLRSIDRSGFDKMNKLRFAHLEKQLLSVGAKIDLLSGKKMTFDEESQALYDTVAPKHEKEYFEKTILELDKLLPGQGDITERLAQFTQQFYIPKEKIPVVFDAALAECRRRTMEFIPLPEEDSVAVEYVTGKPWAAYNWYKGNNHSLIQVSEDLPVSISSTLSWAVHEGYPGHHLHGSLLDMKLFRGKNWVEFSVSPLSSPISVIAEGVANFGREVAFPGDEAFEFQRDTLFPLAGLDSAKAEQYRQVQQLLQKLDYAEIEASRRYLDGEIDREGAIDWLVKYDVMKRDRAERMMSFIEQYRSYIVTYAVGEDIIRDYMERQGVAANDRAKRWALFAEILSTPQTPSGLQ